MARSGGLGNGVLSLKRRGSVEDGGGCERAEKKARLWKGNAKGSRKRVWSEVEGGDVDSRECEDASASRKIIRGGCFSEKDGEEREEHRGVSESSVAASGSKAGDVRRRERRKWKMMPKCGDNDDGSSGRSSKGEVGNGKQSREREVVRKVLQTVLLEESCVAGVEEKGGDREVDSIDCEGVLSSLEQRDKKRRGSTPPQQAEKKLRIAAEQGEGVALGISTATWRRMKGCKATPAPSEDMGVSVSEAWKRLREETNAGTSRSSVNGRSDSDVASESELEMVEERAKKARHDILPLPPQGRQWRKTREVKESSSTSKRLREGGGCESSSGSSGSDLAHPSYYHSRKWKRPRFEYIMSMQGRSWRKQARDVDDDCQDASFVKPTKRQRK